MEAVKANFSISSGYVQCVCSSTNIFSFRQQKRITASDPRRIVYKVTVINKLQVSKKKKKKKKIKKIPFFKLRL
jgi:hypothetical protein